jgi:hypothetical protein
MYPDTSCNLFLADFSHKTKNHFDWLINGRDKDTISLAAWTQKFLEVLQYMMSLAADEAILTLQP